MLAVIGIKQIYDCWFEHERLVIGSNILATIAVYYRLLSFSSRRAATIGRSLADTSQLIRRLTLNFVPSQSGQFLKYLRKLTSIWSRNEDAPSLPNQCLSLKTRIMIGSVNNCLSNTAIPPQLASKHTVSRRLRKWGGKCSGAIYGKHGDTRWPSRDHQVERSKLNLRKTLRKILFERHWE